jgi:hypothetical protein
MVAFQNEQGTLQVPNELITALQRHGERCADLIAEFMEERVLFKDRPVYLPSALLIELSAVVQLRLWEQLGLRSYLNVELPSYREAATALAQRVRMGPAEFEGPNRIPLLLQVLSAWIDHFAWDAPKLLSTDVLIGQVDEDEFAEVLAGFLFEHHEHLSRLSANAKETS